MNDPATRVGARHVAPFDHHTAVEVPSRSQALRARHVAPLLWAVALAASAADFESIREDRYHAPENWLSYDRDNTGQRYSPLDQINASNAADLDVKWVFQFNPLPTRTEPTPLVRDGIMYTPLGGLIAHALDAGTGRSLWRYEYIHEGTGKGHPPNWSRGFALSGERLFMGTFDCHVVAIDARTGAELWRSRVTEKDRCFGSTSAPLVVRNRVMLGSRGGDTGRLRGSLSGFDTETGERVWRFYTVPAPGERGSETWPSDTDAWKNGGGAPWTTGAYDPDLNLLYWTTGNAGPKDFDGRNRLGDNLYTASLLAMDPDNGEYKWHFQFTPHDEHDWDGNQTPVLIDAEWDGKPRKLLVQASRNAFLYVLDRTNGEMLLAEPFAKQTWAKHIAPDGRPVYEEGQAPSTKGSLVCPDIHGGTNWQSPSYSPLTGFFYVATRDACGVYYRTGHSIDHVETGAQQFLRAIDIRTGEKKWEVPFLGDQSQEVNLAGAMTTAGGLVFFSSRVGNFIAADAKTGEILWHFNTGGTIRSSPMTYEHQGKQYVAITSKGGIFVFGLDD